jgi:hypothetical protein
VSAPPRRRRTARAEKAIRLVSACLAAFPFGLLAVLRDSEPFAWTAAGIVLVAILAGPLISPRFTGDR